MPETLPTLTEVPKPLIRAVTELRVLALTWLVTGLVTLAAALLLDSLGELSDLEVDGTALVFGLTVGCSLGAVLLGRRTGPAIAYRELFEIAPQPPRGARGESRRETARRTAMAAIASVAVFMVAALFGLALALLVMGKPREHILDHLPGAAALIAAGWMLVCATVAQVIAGWFERWQRQRGRVILCHPLRSGVVAHVYYVDVDADAATERGREARLTRR